MQNILFLFLICNVQKLQILVHRGPGCARMLSSSTKSHAQRRLIVDQIVLENFKSYAGRQIIGPFHRVRIVESFDLFLTFFEKRILLQLLVQMGLGSLM